MSEIGVSQYNVLSHKLGNKSYFTHCNDEDLDEDTRLFKTMEIVSDMVATGDIICLQEVSRLWYTKLSDFLTNEGYTSIYGGYGGWFNGYMGVMIAFPTIMYHVENTEIIKVGDLIPEIEDVVPEIEDAVEDEDVQPGIFSRFLGVITNASLGFPAGTNSSISKQSKVSAKKVKKPCKPNEYARWRPNTIIMTTLENVETGDVTCIANYHMPCSYWMPDKKGELVASWHVDVIKSLVTQYAGNNNVIFAGDFNITDKSDQYKSMLEYFKDSQCGNNPTCQSQTKDSKEIFSARIDYIFYRNNLKPHVIELPCALSSDDILPNSKHPSDHLPIRTVFKIMRDEN